MPIQRRAAVIVTLVGTVLIWASAAPAQYGALQRTLFRGAEYIGNPLLLSNPQGGPLFDNNLFEQRVEFNRMGEGYTWESFRFFGPDSFGNTNTLDLGTFKMELGLDPTLLASAQPIGIHNRIGYTTRLIPEVFFESQTGQRSFNQFSGLTTFAPAPLHYRITFNAGVQDLTWEGNALIDVGGRVNALGFYDFDMRLTNVGNFEADGILVQDEQVMDFDVGPINVSGHILFDVVAALLQADGAAGDAVAPRIYSGAAQRGKRVEDLLARLEAGDALSGSEARFLSQEMIRAAVLADPLGVLANGLPSELPGFEGFSLSVSEAGELDDSIGSLSSVPEPGTLGLLALVAGGLAIVRPFRRFKRP